MDLRRDVPAVIQDLSHLQGTIGIFGDTHGVWEETIAAIEELNLDHYVFVGDLNDRGPGYRELVNFVMNNENAYSLEGNHESKLLNWLNNEEVRISKGFQVTTEEVTTWPEEERVKLIKWLVSLPSIIKLPDNVLCVHGGLDPTRPLAEQTRGMCRGLRTFGGTKFNDKKAPYWFEHEQHEELRQSTICFGHHYHPTTFVSKNAVSLDGCAVFGGNLRIAILKSGDGIIDVREFPCKEYYIDVRKQKKLRPKD